MADALYDQCLDLVATDVKTLADAIDAALTPEATIEPRRMDWGDVLQYPGVTVRYIEDIETDPVHVKHTNERDVEGFPCIVIMPTLEQAERDPLTRAIQKLKRDIKRHFHSKRRMAGNFTEAGATEDGCTVTEGAPSPPRGITVEKNIDALTVWCWFHVSRTAIGP